MNNTIPEAMEQLCIEFLKVLDQSDIDPFLLISMFILDFLSIHPFNDGNGRMSRLLTLLLLYREGYIVGKYISLEMIIEKTKESYYDSLQASSIGWHENNNDYDRIRNLFANKAGKISKSEIAILCPDISVATIEKVLGDFLKEEYIFIAFIFDHIISIGLKSGL